MAKSSRAWMQRHVTDTFVRQSKVAGYRSRAAYKLAQIDAQDRLLKPGMTVVDLGAAPGGWAQVAAQKVGAKGKVVAIDLLPMAPLPGVTFIQADFDTPEGLAALEAALVGQAADLVLSDISPNLSGIRDVDQARWAHLAELAMDFSEKHLKPGGDLLVKGFHGREWQGFLAALKQRFDKVSVRKPEASRSESAEVYVLARGKR